MTGEGDATTPEMPAPKREGNFKPVSFRKEIIARIDALWESLGYKSRAEYLKLAVLKQLEHDEAERRNLSDEPSGESLSERRDDLGV
jgi:hypothetical protein